MEPVRMLQGYTSVRMPRQMKPSYKLETLLRDIAELSSNPAERDIAAFIYYAPEYSTGPLTLAAVNASFVREI